MRGFQFLLISFLSVSMLACGGAEKSSDQASQETPNAGQDTTTPATPNSQASEGKALTIGQQCDLSAYANLEQNRIDFKHSSKPVLLIFNQHIVDFQLDEFTDQAAQDAHFQEMIDKKSVRLRTELKRNPICSITYAELRSDVLSGAIPLDELLNKFCPQIQPVDLSLDADTAKEKELMALIKSRMPDLHDQIMRSHKVILADEEISNSVYMAFNFSIIRNGNILAFEPSKTALKNEELNGYMDVLNYTGTEEQRCEVTPAP